MTEQEIEEELTQLFDERNTLNTIPNEDRGKFNLDMGIIVSRIQFLEDKLQELKNESAL